MVLTSLELWQSLGHTQLESEKLIVQMQLFESQLLSFDFPYVLDIYTPKIWRELTEANLQDACYISSIGNIMSYEKEQISIDNKTSDISNKFTTLLINEIINLEIEENSEFPIAETAQVVLSENFDYDSSDVLNSFLEHKKQNR
ncbi:8851_t:CDS:2 [Cetraspora pellucida]|uniref:8851_t:CDS:1 n=1 Tax=Cetraspora pellucida TaxID=1433469 RepID=A0A9N8Z4Q5_9GLOM|nr:8851_t:CDS:2 [Cetraspora pellucida]